MWIKVKDKLPLVNEPVLFALPKNLRTSRRKVSIGFTEHRGQYWWDMMSKDPLYPNENLVVEDVELWQPLPEVE